MLFSTINDMCSRIVCRVVVIVVVCLVGCQQEVLIEESSAIETLHAPTGGAVELPCDVTPSLPDDRMGLVIWYKQGHDTPIYSFDIREGVTSHWSDPSTLGARATFRGETVPAVLVLTQLRPEDSGQYRCRVDFIKSPTKNTRLNLTILIPPERLIVLNQEGDELKNGVLGPYDEGTLVNLTCIAVGGHPTSRVSWWKAHELLANSEARATVSFTLQRADHGTHVTCQAVTDPSIPPVSEVISIDVNLRLLWLRLAGGARPLVAGQAAELVCQAVGARPKPSISWWKGGTRLKSSREIISSDGNITSSVLTLVPALADAGRVVSCRAVQRAPLATYEDGWPMQIQHVPVVTLELGANLDASKVVEGSDVYLDCRVKANPWHSHVYFTNNGIPVKPSPGVLLANQSLVLQKVSRKAAGDYVCVARNSIGEGSSETLNLDVKYTPTCKSSRPIILRAAKREIVDINCDVEANPSPLYYQWWFNSSSHGKLELPTTMLNNKLRNYLYMVNSSSDYGWIQCSASNSVGRQESPCLFRIQQADKPSQVKDCEIMNVTYSSLSVRCIAGQDGGVRQTFLMQLLLACKLIQKLAFRQASFLNPCAFIFDLIVTYHQIMDMSTGSLLRNVTSDDPEFRAPGLPAGSTLSVSVSAYNKQGASAPVSLTANLLKFPQQQTAALVPVKVELTTVLTLVLASVAAVAALAVMCVAIVCCTKPRRPTAKNEKDKTKPDEMLPSTGNKEVETFDSLDKNPDIIPTENRTGNSCSNQSSSSDYSSIRPLVPNCSRKNYDVPSNCERFYDHNIDYNQYVQVRPMDARIRPTYQPVTKFGTRIQSIGKISSVGLSNVGPNDCYRQTDKTKEDWLKYKNSLPLSTSGLLPTEQLMPPELYPPPLLYSNPRPIHLSHMPDLEYGYNQESRSLLDSRSCSSSPLVRFQDNSVYFNKSVADLTRTMPNSKR